MSHLPTHPELSPYLYTHYGEGVFAEVIDGSVQFPGYDPEIHGTVEAFEAQVESWVIARDAEIQAEIEAKIDKGKTLAIQLAMVETVREETSPTISQLHTLILTMADRITALENP